MKRYKILRYVLLHLSCILAFCGFIVAQAEDFEYYQLVALLYFGFGIWVMVVNLLYGNPTVRECVEWMLLLIVYGTPMIYILKLISQV